MPLKSASSQTQPNTPAYPAATVAGPAFQYTLGDMLRYLDVYRSRLRIAIVYGGNKDQGDAVIYRTVNPRPWKSYFHVAEEIQGALQEIGFRHVLLLPDDMSLPQRLKE